MSDRTPRSLSNSLVTQSSFESAAADLASALLKISIRGEEAGDRASVRGCLRALRRHARDALERSVVSALKEDVAGLPLFSPDGERPLGRRGYLSLVFELDAWAGGAAGKTRAWLAPRADAPYTAADAARDNFVATKSVTYADRRSSLKA